MKKTRILLPLVLGLSALNLQSCAKTLEVKNYAISTTKNQYGVQFAQIDLKVTNGAISSISIDETYSPTTWARLSDADATSLGEDNVLSVNNVTLEDGSKGTLKFAKYISVCGMNWVGQVRDEDNKFYKSYYDYIQYSYVDCADMDNSADSDLVERYLVVKDTSTQFSDRAGTYYTDVTSGNNKILKNTGTAEAVKLEETSVTPYYPNGNKVRSTNESEWKASIDALCTYLVGKKINYKDVVQDDDIENHYSLVAEDGVWTYCNGLGDFKSDTVPTAAEVKEVIDNGTDTITGCKATVISDTSINAYFSAINIAFASVEYNSIY